VDVCVSVIVAEKVEEAVSEFELERVGENDAEKLIVDVGLSEIVVELDIVTLVLAAGVKDEVKVSVGDAVTLGDVDGVLVIDASVML
jgi:hypothetical protein